ncbi:SIALI-17 repeat-containing surface protein [Streptococcus oralis]|uniref:Merozoite surface protein 3 alpha n=1 Tax=Streptococcus oralis TaxID=1303 RepID=A0A139QY87_STROR|nr:SIALI-17 repeat-containing surface protein [Streptococcus oralis]KXU07529.1 Merozoite surface protein 3 alpha [Streptococcus oralis]
MDKRKVILTSLASAAVLGASVLVSQPSVVKADEGKAEEQAVAPAQPQAGTEGESGAQTEKGSENASPANPGAANPAKMTKEELMEALDELEEQAISDIEDKEAIEDKEDAAEAVKEYIGKMYISDTLESGELSLDNIIAELPEGAEDKTVVTDPEVQTNKKLSTEEKTLLDQAEKDAKEQVSQATDALVQALESLENAVIEDIKKDASITNKETAIKEAKEEIGKEDLLKAIADEDLESGDVIVDWLADTSEHKTAAEPVSEFTDEDQAKLATADKEVAEENSNAKKLELSKLEEQVAKIKVQLSSLQVSGDKNSQIKDLQQALADYEDAIKTLSSVMSAVLEIEDFKGGVNAVEAATAELPEYNKGANAVEAAVNELPAYAESGAPVVANVPAYGESGAPIVNNALPYAESGAPAVANVPAYGESGTPIVSNTLPYAESGAPAVANVPAYGESGTPIVNNTLPYAESGAPAVANIPVYAESGAPAVATIPAYAEKIEPAVNEVPEYTGSVAPLATNPTLGTKQDRTYKAPAATDEQLLPNTGSQDASAVASLGFIGLLLGLLPFAKRKLNK